MLGNCETGDQNAGLLSDVPPPGGLASLKWRQLQENTSTDSNEVRRGEAPKPRHGHRCVFVDLPKREEDDTQLAEGEEQALSGPQLLSIFGGDRGLINEVWAWDIGKSRTTRTRALFPLILTFLLQSAWAMESNHAVDHRQDQANGGVCGCKCWKQGLHVRRGPGRERVRPNVERGELLKPSSLVDCYSSRFWHLYNQLYELDGDAMSWRRLYTTHGQTPSLTENAPDFCLGAAMVHVPSREEGHPGTLWVFGGLNHDHEPLEQLLSFDLQTMKWTECSAANRGPEKRESCSMVLWENEGKRKLVLYGGMIGDDDESRKRVSDVWTLDIGEL
jgi:hypothetical protein